ncbi:MAG: TonB-dependent receptor plug domain-containing protein [Cellvibrionaceae bacterium]
MSSYSIAEDIDLDIDSETPKFITPVKTSDRFDSPNSVTLLEQDDLKALGIFKVTDAMRLVPGILVSETHGNKVFVEYHGGNRYRSRRTQLLFNSQKFSRPVDDEILWPRLPFDIRDLSYLEVIRGSSVVDFSSNSFTSAINLAQDPVALRPNAFASGQYASNDEHDFSTSFRFNINESINHFRFRGLKNVGASDSPQSNSFLDEQEGYSFLWNGEVETGSGLLDWSLVGADFEFEYPTLNALGNADSEAALELAGVSYPFTASEKTLRFAIEHSGTYSGKIDIDWNYGLLLSGFDRDQIIRFCLPAFIYDPILAELDTSDNVQIVSADFDLLIASSLITGTGQLNESILSPLTSYQLDLLDQFGSIVQGAGQAAATENLCGNTNQNFSEERSNLLGGMTFHFDNAKLSSNFNFQHFTVNSDTFFDGEHNRTSIEWANDLLYKHDDKLSSHLGLLAEYNSDIDDTFVSSRYALNYRFTPLNNIMFKVAQSYRLPSVFETNKKLQYRVAYLDGQADYNGNTESDVLRLTISPDLDPEKIITREIEYTHANNIGSIFSFKLFDEDRYDLISQPDGYVVNDLTNSGSVNIRGYELGFRQEVSSLNDLVVGGSYARIDTETNQIEELSIAADWVGSFWSILPLSETSTIGFVHYRNDEIAGEDYKRTDVNYTKVFQLNGYDLGLGINYRRYPDRQINYSQFSVSDPLITNYNDNEVYNLTLSLTY